MISLHDGGNGDRGVADLWVQEFPWLSGREYRSSSDWGESQRRKTDKGKECDWKRAGECKLSVRMVANNKAIVAALLALWQYGTSLRRGDEGGDCRAQGSCDRDVYSVDSLTATQQQHLTLCHSPVWIADWFLLKGNVLTCSVTAPKHRLTFCLFLSFFATEECLSVLVCCPTRFVAIIWLCCSLLFSLLSITLAPKNVTKLQIKL